MAESKLNVLEHGVDDATVIAVQRIVQIRNADIAVGLINIVISMYYYLIVVKKMYVTEPHDRSPVKVSGPIKVVVYVCLIGTLAIGVYPQPVTDWVVSAILVFSHFADPTASLPVPPTVIPLGG